MLSDQTARLRSYLKRAEELTRGEYGRFVDYGIELRIVAQDVESGIAYLPEAPPLRALDVIRIGGVLDTVTRRIVRETENPVVWYLGQKQAEIVLAFYRRDSDRATRILLYSAEGGGKTVLMAQAMIAFIVGLAVAGVPGNVGATAPTDKRLRTFIDAVTDRVPVDGTQARFPGAWGTYHSDDREIRMASGHVVQFRATKKQSGATGSPVQGFSWLASFDDELQDTAENGSDPDIEARLRAAKTSFRLGTATAKDSPLWRTFRDAKNASPDWLIERLRYDENPFVWAEHWERMRRNMSMREWQRRGLALDVGPELQVYTTWDRDKNLRPVAQIGLVDVTADVLSPWGRNHKLLIGHDPGRLVNYSLFLKAFRARNKPDIYWWVVGELATERSTTEEHVKKLNATLRDKWGINRVGVNGKLIEGGDTALVRADPYSNSGNDNTKPDRSVYTVFKSAGIKILPAAMRTATSAKGITSGAASIPKEAGIQMVVGLFCNADEQRRLFVACDDKRTPCAPKLVESLELSERDASGQAETQRKDEYDLSHPTAALRYALYELERERLKGVG